MDEEATGQRTMTAPQFSPRDMELSESFHRLKRTALLLSTALIVLGLASTPDPAVFKLAFTDVSLDVRWVHVLLSAGAIYYAVGFWFEVQVARQLHGAHMEAADENKFVEMMRRLSKRLTSQQHWHANLGERLTSMVDELASRMETAASVTHSLRGDFEAAVLASIQKDRRAMENWAAVPLGTRPSSPPNPNLAADELTKSLLAIVEKGGSSRPFGELPAELAQLNTDVARWTAGAEDLAGILKDLHTKMRRLAPDIAQARRWSFWGFEVGGVGAPLVLGLGLVWWPYAARLAEYALAAIRPG